MLKMNLKALRCNFGLNQKQAAEAIGVSETTWYNYENGKTFPDSLKIKKIEKVFGIRYDDILFSGHLRLNRTDSA